ncbi:MAG TPA: monovalent cation:proton antiporter-2 (CPA2) family protein [Chitinophagaceae bacterium]
MDPSSFLFQAFVYLCAMVVFVPLARRLGLGSVLGYLLAGIVIGPYVLGVVGEEGQDLMHFAEFGVVMMLFLIGLELEPGVLWGMRRAIIGLGTGQVLVSAAVIGALALVAGFNWQQALAAGLILSLSSTAIVMQSLQEKGWLKSEAGQSAFAVLLFQDIAVIPMLALFPLLATTPRPGAAGGEEHLSWIAGLPPLWQTVIVLASIVGIIAAGRLVITPAMRLVARTGMREVFTAFALFIVVGIAVLMTGVGLSPALGAFLAGVVLANSEYRHELESDIEPFKGILLGLFFIAVGASVNFPLIAEQPGTVVTWVVVLIAVKSVVLLGLGRVFRLGTDQNLIFSSALAQVGEFAFVLASLALQEGVLPPATVQLLIAVVAITMALTPLVMLFNERFLLPRVGTREAPPTRVVDAISARNPVIIAGFGHFGNTVGRFLRANNVPATYLDIDSDTVDVLRKMGFKVFYGDASRYDLLEAAGAREARIIVIAIDSKEKRLEMIETVKKHFPHLNILVRAANRYDAYDQMNAGMLHVYRETVDTAIRMGVDTLKLLGVRAYTAHRKALTFLRHDERNLKQLAAIRNDEEYITEARKFIEEIELILQADRHDPTRDRDEGWDADGLRKEAREESL